VTICSPISLSKKSLVERSAANPLAQEKVWRLAANFSKLPELLRRTPGQ
jgi:hypothetical protein